MVIVSPSILSADFARLGEEIKAVEDAGADWIHIDVMDGHFVPNITIGPVVVSKIRGLTDLLFDVHLMIEKPDRFIDAFIDAGADLLTIHSETCEDILKVIEGIKSRSCKAGVSINPDTPVESIRDVIDHVDLILVMSVHPGFSGQRFIPSSIDKIKKTRGLIDESSNKDVYLQVDGGVTDENAKSIVENGANVLVAGNYIFKSKDYKKAIRNLKIF
ncbi:MAG: ribulose-phosphate 3-epimerase [Candidatus Thermoplasmatota archaeon]